MEDAQLLFYLGLKVADAARMPAWKPGDEFEGARKKALLAVKVQESEERDLGRHPERIGKNAGADARGHEEPLASSTTSPAA